MTDAELIARLRERAAEDRDIQRNNEAVAAALMGQRLLFDQGIRSKANSFAVRLGLEYESCAKNDAKLACYWDAAADRIEALIKERDEAMQLLQTLSNMNGGLSRDMYKTKLLLAKAVEALEEIGDRHIPDQPATYGGNEADWAQRQHTALRSIARAALAELKGDSHE